MELNSAQPAVDDAIVDDSTAKESTVAPISEDSTAGDQLDNDSTAVEEANLPPHPPVNTPGGLDLPFRPDVEGLRAIAVVLVVLYHSQVSWLPGGFIGVDVFFVLSGFLITGLLIKEHSVRRRISILGFYARRARRILPAAMTVIVLSVAASYLIQNFVTYGTTNNDGRWSTFFLANFHLNWTGANYFLQGIPPSPMQHYWSLAVEEQFYVVWPLAILIVGLLFRRVNIRWRVLAIATVGSVASFIWSYSQTIDNSSWAYFSPYTRAWELGVGAIIATLVPNFQRLPVRLGAVIAWGGLIAIMIGAVVLSGNSQYPGTAALWPVLGAGAVVIGGASGLGASHVLALRPVRSIGRVSYGWYLLHYPLMIILVGGLWSHFLSVEENLVIAAVTLALAYLMYWLLERPIRKSVFLARQPVVSIGVGLLFVGGALLFCYLLVPFQGAPWVP